jgi:hypothetical protein
MNHSARCGAIEPSGDTHSCNRPVNHAGSHCHTLMGAHLCMWDEDGWQAAGDEFPAHNMVGDFGQDEPQDPWANFRQ